MLFRSGHALDIYIRSHRRSQRRSHEGCLGLPRELVYTQTRRTTIAPIHASRGESISPATASIVSSSSNIGPVDESMRAGHVRAASWDPDTRLEACTNLHGCSVTIERAR